MRLHELCALALLAATGACGGSGSACVDKSQLVAQLAAAECTEILGCCAGTSGAPSQAS